MAGGAGELSGGRFAGRLLAVGPEEVAGRGGQGGGAPVGVGHDDSFLDGIENRFENSFLLREAKQVILHLFGADAAEASSHASDGVLLPADAAGATEPQPALRAAATSFKRLFTMIGEHVLLPYYQAIGKDWFAWVDRMAGA